MWQPWFSRTWLANPALPYQTETLGILAYHRHNVILKQSLDDHANLLHFDLNCTIQILPPLLHVGASFVTEAQWEKPTRTGGIRALPRAGLRGSTFAAEARKLPRLIAAQPGYCSSSSTCPCLPAASCIASTTRRALFLVPRSSSSVPV